MIMLFFSVVSIVSRIFLRILSSLIMKVFLFLSRPMVRFSFSASSVRLMYSASSFLLSWRAMVVFPTQGVPVTRMTHLFIVVKEVGEILIACPFATNGRRFDNNCWKGPTNRYRLVGNPHG